MPQPELRTLLVDLGNVLAFFSHEKMCRQLAEVCGVAEAEMHRLLIADGLQWQFETGKISPEDFAARLADFGDRRPSLPELRRAHDDIFRPNTAMVPILNSAKAAGLRLVLLSNTDPWHFSHIRDGEATAELLAGFDAFALSYEAGTLKPGAAIYDRALDFAGCRPEECFYVDDIAEYVTAARDRKIQAAVFVDAEDYRRELVERGVDLGG